MPSPEPGLAIPAQLSFLAIYNPSLGQTDETLHDQIVFYFSHKTRRRGFRNAPENDFSKEDENEKLRQVGLAQGMVEFARNFSDHEDIDSVETDRSRIVLQELESGWWIVASVDYARLPVIQSSSRPDRLSPKFEYSARELAPAHLLLRQLRKAHSIFLLHHAPSLEILFRQLSRDEFCLILDRFWVKFIRRWDVILNGNPAVDVFDGMKLSGSGELGIGLGEEEWGSGERDVLQNFVSRTDGLIDLIVSRFGDAPGEHQGQKKGVAQDDAWLGCEFCPKPSDGVIFSGTGAVSRLSVTQVSQWMEWIFRYGEDAYGIKDDPRSPRIRRRRKVRRGDRRQYQKLDLPPGIPPPLIGPSLPAHEATSGRRFSNLMGTSNLTSVGTEAFMKVLTLGYGSAWGGSVKDKPSTEPLKADFCGQDAVPSPAEEAPGHFILGLRDDLENEDSDEDSKNQPNEHQIARSKFVLRRLCVEGKRELGTSQCCESDDGMDYIDLQAVIYVRQPFMFTFLFTPSAPALTNPHFYRGIHHQLGPLQTPLLSSTSPDKASDRTLLTALFATAPADAGTFIRGKGKRKAPIPSLFFASPLYHIVHDPHTRIIHSSLPNIPEPAIPPTVAGRHGATGPSWSRAEALGVQVQVLNTYADTRVRPSEMERAVKTGHDWWVVWMRIDDDEGRSDEHHEGKEKYYSGDGEASSPDTLRAPLQSKLIPTSQSPPSTALRSGPRHSYGLHNTSKREGFLIRRADGSSRTRGLGVVGVGSSIVTPAATTAAPPDAATATVTALRSQPQSQIHPQPHSHSLPLSRAESQSTSSALAGSSARFFRGLFGAASKSSVSPGLEQSRRSTTPGSPLRSVSGVELGAGASADSDAGFISGVTPKARTETETEAEIAPVSTPVPTQSTSTSNDPAASIPGAAPSTSVDARESSSAWSALSSPLASLSTAVGSGSGSGAGVGSDASGLVASWSTPARLVEGVGLDARRYIDTLFNYSK